MSLFILCPIIIAVCCFSSSSDMRHTRFMVTIHGSYTMLLSHTCIYLRLSSVFNIILASASIRPSFPTHPLIFTHTSVYILKGTS